MNRTTRAGAAYFAPVFAAGFGLGLVRALLVAPATGEVAAVLIEIPAILTIAWFACGWTIRRFGVPSRPGARARMGATALLLLMLAELAVATLLVGVTAGDYLRSFARLSVLLGLAAFFVYAMLPVVHRAGRASPAGRGKDDA